MTESENRNKEIVRKFSRAAGFYDEQADIQREIARRLLASLKPWRDILPPGPVLEIGCGTGFVTQGLLDMYPDRKLEITDISPDMIEVCKSKYGDSEHTEFRVMDAEHAPMQDPKYAMTISNFVAHWFRDPALSLGRWLEITKPGGLLLASFPGNESFPEWKQQCRDLGIPFTGNTLPDTEEMVVKLSTGPAQVDYYEDTVTRRFDSAADFFRNMKQVGSGSQFSGRHLSPAEMKMLIRHWDEQNEVKIQVSYHIIFLAVKRDYNS